MKKYKFIELEPGVEWEYKGVKFIYKDNDSFLWNNSHRILIKDDKPGYHCLRHRTRFLNVIEFYNKYVKYCC